MDLMTALRQRRSIRRYQERPIPEETLKTLLDAAKTAPSAGNLRSRKFLVVTNPQIMKALGLAAYSQPQFSKAAALVVICADVPRSSARYGDRGSLFAIQDADAACMCLLLAAHALGLGACWNGAFDDALVRDLLSLEKGVLPVAIISLGWPDQQPADPGGSQEEAVSWIT
ncbi:MAG: nitroreductase A [Methanosaeta sp. PtaB.Bin039]|nr:MAG: nitroreductase A [Methanosaeta sp. PtaB.Bin039]OPY45061.1 MAG: nitroreductase A [Methanosaeta sp. PtaU1.Bin028]HOT06662.1 nitroreductase family protein [Methanotrichaceae archaeon]HQF16690.1 nitroreductase family protein [Methanotrichaceae archaeon]HQI91298.1 nitroreductase family protein [Methanotrichaceae archaeon]